MTEELQGRVLKNYNGYYYVLADSSSEIYTCKVKGRMKKNRFSLATGDIVIFELSSKEKCEGMITAVMARKNFLVRPTMANIDLFVAAFACVNPDFSYLLADKLLALAKLANIPALLVLNKEDNAPKGLIEQIRKVYESIGYEVYAISARCGTGIETLRERLRGKICAFGGPSGVGKSSTINAIDNSVDLRIGAVSEKIGRGRHTTRYAQLLPFDDGYIADTPGFGNLLLEGLNAEQVRAGFREFTVYETSCRFCPCTHTHEPVCGVKEAVAAGEIAASRYESYIAMLDEVRILQEKEGRK